MSRRWGSIGCVLAFVLVLFNGCGGGTSTSTTPGNGNLYAIVGDQPVCDALSFRFLVDGLTMTGPNGAAATVLGTNTAIRVDFAALHDFNTFLAQTSIAAGTYNQVTIPLSDPNLTMFEILQSPPTSVIVPTLTVTTPTFTISPPLVITANQASVLRLDFDMARSIQVDSSGNVSNQVTPVFNVSSLSQSATQGFGEMDDVFGFVESVSPTAISVNNTNFTGSFTMEFLNGTGPAITFYTSGSTQLVGVPALNQLATGSFVELNTHVDQNGNAIADVVNVEDREIVENNELAFLGYVTSVTRDSNGNVTQFSFYVRDEEPDSGFVIPLDSVVVVTPTSTTGYQVPFPQNNVNNLAFSAANIVPGQELIVSGVYTKVTAPAGSTLTPPSTVAPTQIILKPQTHQGNFAVLYAAAPDNLTGAFLLVPCAQILGGAPIYVYTTSATQFVNVNGLTGLSAGPSLLVKGQLWYEAQSGNINGVIYPPGSLVMQATEVHQL